ncbi:MAG: cupin domain-containing protein [Candidatus Aenigmarchaeota archaeon]|nr:cupin domain-containing protein [Candidatus Aenigmarchaeota archaeon]
MKTYTHSMEPGQRSHVFGLVTGDHDAALGFYSGADVPGEAVHYHEESDEIYLPVRGRGAIWVAGKIYPLQPGVVRRVEKGTPHRLLSLNMSFACYSIQVPSLGDKVELETPLPLQDLLRRHNLE